MPDLALPKSSSRVIKREDQAGELAASLGRLIAGWMATDTPQRRRFLQQRHSHAPRGKAA